MKSLNLTKKNKKSYSQLNENSKSYKSFLISRKSKKKDQKNNEVIESQENFKTFKQFDRFSPGNGSLRKKYFKNSKSDKVVNISLSEDNETTEFDNFKSKDIEEQELITKSDSELQPRSSPRKSQKREVTIAKDEEFGFGFIAGSEKPLVIRFVSPGK